MFAPGSGGCSPWFRHLQTRVDRFGLGALRYGGPCGSPLGWGSILLFLCGRVSNLFCLSYPPHPSLPGGAGEGEGRLGPNRFDTRPNGNDTLDPQPYRLPQGPPYRKASSPNRSRRQVLHFLWNSGETILGPRAGAQAGGSPLHGSHERCGLRSRTPTPSCSAKSSLAHLCCVMWSFFGRFLLDVRLGFWFGRATLLCHSSRSTRRGWGRGDFWFVSRPRLGDSDAQLLSWLSFFPLCFYPSFSVFCVVHSLCFFLHRGCQVIDMQEECIA